MAEAALTIDRIRPALPIPSSSDIPPKMMPRTAIGNAINVSHQAREIKNNDTKKIADEIIPKTSDATLFP
jgi:hypothetical protein